MLWRKLIGASTAYDFEVSFDIGTPLVSRFACHVWRNVDLANPFDAAIQTSINNTSGFADPPAITTATSGAVVVPIGANASSGPYLASLFGSPNQSSNFFTSGVADNSQIGIASISRSSPGTYDPASFGGGTSSSNSAVSATIALKRGASSLAFVGGASSSGASSQYPNFKVKVEGGLGAVQSGDLIIAAIAFKSSTDNNIACTSSGYTELCDLYANSSNDVQLAVYYNFVP